MIAHIVLFEPKPGITNDQKRSFAQLLRVCARDIPSVKRAIVGPISQNNTVDRLLIGDKTYSFAAVFEFEDRGGLESYFTHESHRQLAALFWELCQATTFVDAQMADAKTVDLASILV